MAGLISKNEGFEEHSFGGEVRVEAAGRGIEIKRGYLQQLGYDLTEEFGEPYWALRILARVRPVGDHVVEGFRYVGNVEVFRKQEKHKFSLVCVEASYEILLRRYLAEPGVYGRVRTLESFRIAYDRDLGIAKGLQGQESHKVFEMADYTVKNEGTPEELWGQFRVVLDRIRGQNV